LISQELCQTVVGVASSEFNFVVFVAFFKIRRSDLELLSLCELSVRVVGHIFWIVQFNSDVFVEISRKLVAVHDSESSFVKSDVSGYVEVCPVENLLFLAEFSHHFLSFQEPTLRNPGIFDCRLGNVDCVVA